MRNLLQLKKRGETRRTITKEKLDRNRFVNIPKAELQRDQKVSAGADWNVSLVNVTSCELFCDWSRSRVVTLPIGQYDDVFTRTGRDVNCCDVNIEQRMLTPSMSQTTKGQ